MATFSDSTTLPKIQQAFSRRTLVREMAAGASLALVPTVALATPIVTPRDRLAALVEEIKVVAREINPAINDWKIVVNLNNEIPNGSCPLFIAAFETPSERVSEIGATWRFRQPVQS